MHAGSSPGASVTTTKRTSWLDCFPKVTNGELQGLYRFSFTTPVQLQIVLCLLAKTRGTGRLMSGAVEPDGHDEWQEALGEYGCDAVAIFDGQLAAELGRDTRQVARERRRLIAAGIVVEHRCGHKSTPHVLSVNLDSSEWRPIPSRSGANRLPKSSAEVPSDDTRVSQLAPESAGCGSQSAPDGGSQSAPESQICGSQLAPLLKRREIKSSETLKETCDPRAAEERGSHHIEALGRDGCDGFRHNGDVIKSASLRSAIERAGSRLACEESR